MKLLIGEHTLNIAQIAPEFLVVRDSIELDGPLTGEIWQSVDGEVSEWEIELPNGVKGPGIKIPILTVPVKNKQVSIA